ncbi:MAG: hypothetical protein IJ457_10005 [Clostridia bacterium]|nr:hypothetical protein [Clostridia bacterium]
MNDRHDFSKEYEEKKKALLRSIEKLDMAEKPRVSAARRPMIRAVVAVVLAVTLLSGGVLAASQLGLFNIRHEEDRILVEVATGETVSQQDYVNEYFEEYYDRDNRQPYEKFALYRGYMPPVTECEPGYDRPQQIGSGGTAMNIFMTRYLEGKAFDIKLPPNVETKFFMAGDNRAMLVYCGETRIYDKLLFVEFAEKKIMVFCSIGNLISMEETVKFAEGLRLENTDSFELSYGISIGLDDHTAMLDDYDAKKYHPISKMERRRFGEAFEYGFGGVEMRVTTLSAEVYDSAEAFDHERFFMILEGDENRISLFMDPEGRFIEYPRTEIIRSTKNGELDRFGETELIKKKLVRVSYSVENISDKNVQGSASELLYIGDTMEGMFNYVYDSTPHVIVNGYPVYTEISSERLAPGETGTVNLYYLIDEDLIDEASIVFMNYKDNNGDIDYYGLRIDEYVKLADR